MILAVLQARVSSTRLPGKVLKPLLGKPMLLQQIERILRSGRINRLVVATSSQTEDDGIEDLCNQAGISCYRGSLDDVLDRFYQAAVLYKPEHVVRLTGDCPLIDPAVIDAVIDYHVKGNYDYTSNTIEPSFPDGLDVEAVKMSVLEHAWRHADRNSEREHVTLYIHQRPAIFRLGSYRGERDLSSMRWTVDEPEDYEFITRIYEALYVNNREFAMQDVLDYLQCNPAVQDINKHYLRNEGLARSLQNDKVQK